MHLVVFVFYLRGLTSVFFIPLGSLSRCYPITSKVLTLPLAQSLYEKDAVE